MSTILYLFFCAVQKDFYQHTPDTQFLSHPFAQAGGSSIYLATRRYTNTIFNCFYHRLNNI
jgi:hypothetical protein